MSRLEFYLALRRTARKVRFRVTREGLIRDRFGRCPIEAVAGMPRTGVSQLMAAESRLGFDGPEASRVISAADWAGTEKSPAWQRRERRRLLRATGLAEEVTA